MWLILDHGWLYIAFAKEALSWLVKWQGEKVGEVETILKKLLEDTWSELKWTGS